MKTSKHDEKLLLVRNAWLLPASFLLPDCTYEFIFILIIFTLITSIVTLMEQSHGNLRRLRSKIRVARMSRVSLLLFVLVALFAGVAHAHDDNDGRVKNVVVLMLENRSFDHMLGFMKSVNGVAGKQLSNAFNTTDPLSLRAHVTRDAQYVVADPPHSIDATTRQLWGGDAKPRNTPPPMTGFVETMERSFGYKSVDARPKCTPTSVGGDGDKDGDHKRISECEISRTVMSSFEPAHLPVLHTLASEYAVFDEWHASVPGPTQVNRLFALSGTSHGMVSDNKLKSR
jgi:phospholipase C